MDMTKAMTMTRENLAAALRYAEKEFTGKLGWTMIAEGFSTVMHRAHCQPDRSDLEWADRMLAEAETNEEWKRALAWAFARGCSDPDYIAE